IFNRILATGAGCKSVPMADGRQRVPDVSYRHPILSSCLKPKGDIIMAQKATPGMLQSLSSELAGVVEKVGPSVVRVDDGTRLTATGLIWSANGLIVTTSHGVERDEELVVELHDGNRLP